MFAHMYRSHCFHIHNAPKELSEDLVKVFCDLALVGGISLIVTGESESGSNGTVDIFDAELICPCVVSQSRCRVGDQDVRSIAYKQTVKAACAWSSLQPKNQGSCQVIVLRRWEKNIFLLIVHSVTPLRRFPINQPIVVFIPHFFFMYTLVLFVGNFHSHRLSIVLNGLLRKYPNNKK